MSLHPLALGFGRRSFWKAVAALALGLGSGPAAWAAKPADGTLVAAFARELLTLDNFDSTSRDNEIVSLLIDDALFYIDPATRQPVPLVAKDYKLVDPKTLEVGIRSDVTFHDGTPLTADDVVYTFQTIINPKNAARKADNFAKWLEAVEKAGPDRVRFRMKGPNPLALHLLATGGRVVKRGTYDNPSDPSGLNANAQANRMIGAGPYRVVSFSPGRELVVERYAGYRAGSPKGLPSIPRLRFRVIPDYATQAAEVLSGGVHWTYNMPTDIAEEVASTKRANMIASPSMRIGYLIVDAAGRSGKGHPLTKAKVRQALSLAIDREMLVKKLLRGRSAAAYTPCLPVQFGCDQDIPVNKFNPERAKQLLAEAGHASGLSFELWASREKETLEAVVEMWRRIGVNATLRIVKSPAMSKARSENALSIYFENNGSVGIADVGALLPNQFSEGSPSDWHHDRKLYQLVDGLLTTNDAAERRKIARQATTLINESVYWIPLYEFTQNFLVSPDLDYPQADDGMQRLFLAKWKR
ncbi:MAG: ABC transporter substrate-binding protein [Rubrivivax sp.]